MKEERVKIGDKYLVPTGTKLWFIDLQQTLITTKKYVVVATQLVCNDGSSFFGHLYEITYEGMTLPGLREVLHGKTWLDLGSVEPLGDILEPKIWEVKF